MNSKLKNEFTAFPVYDNAVKMLAALKERNPEWKSSPNFRHFRCLGKLDCDKPCLWLEGTILNENCPLYQGRSLHLERILGPPATEFNGLLDYWDKLQVSEYIMNMIIENPLSESESHNPMNYLNVREMAKLAGKSPRTIIKYIRQGKVWARSGKIRTINFGYVATIEDFNNFLEFGLSKGVDSDYPDDVNI